MAKNVSGMSLNSGQGGDSEKVPKKNKSRGGSSAVRHGLSQGSAWGQADTAQRLGFAKASRSGPTPGNVWQNSIPHSGRGRPQAMAPLQTVSQHGSSWAARVGSQAVKHDQSEKAAEEEEDDDDDKDDAFDDDDDDGLYSDEDPEESPPSNESLKNHKLLKVFFEMLDKLTLEEINDSARQWHCPACQGGPGAIDWYKGLQPLANHARTKGTKRVKLHRIFGKLLEEELQMRGTSTIPAGEVFGNWEGLKTETKDHEIVWPPMVLVLNTRLDKGDDDKWLGMGNQELVDYFSSYSPVKARHSYGPQGHRGISLLLFENSAVGYLAAERLHKHFLEQGTGREAWERRPNFFSYGGKRQLYGCLATKDDLEFFNQHCQGKQRMKYDMRSYNEMVVSQMKQMSEDNHQLYWFKHKVAKEQRHSKVLEESLSFMSEKLRKTSEENRIVKQRSKMHHQQHQEELDFQDNFFKEQMEQIQEGVTAKEDSFEKFHQDERKKAEDLNVQASSAEDRRRRMEEMERFIQSQDTEISQFVLERDELQKVHDKKQDELKKRYREEMLTLEKEFEASLTQLMEKYAPGSISGNA